jgi:hypothetical protein
MAYILWQDVLDIFPKAATIESNGTNQTNLIAAKSDLFDSFTRNIRKKAWTETVNELVKQAVAHLVAGELYARRYTDDTNLELIEFEHIKAMMNRFDMFAHSLIASIRKGAFVADEDLATRDLIHPDAEVITKTGSGAVDVWCPHGYTGYTKDIYTIIFTTAGRVEDETAVLSVYKNYGDDDPMISAESIEGGYLHLANGLYVRFRDTATSGNSFAVDDEFKIIAAPLTAESMSTGPQQIDFYSG